MNLTNNIQANRKIIPKVYTYTIPDYPPNKGWVKIGDTTRDKRGNGRVFRKAIKSMWGTI